METPYSELAGMLGITGSGSPQLGPVQIMDRIQQGLSIKALYSVSTQIAPGDKQFVFRIVPKASLARRKNGLKPLSADESNRLARLAGVWSLANSIWHNVDDVRAFLFRPHLMLDDRRPIDCVLESEIGADLVKNILGRLVHGTAA
jgi:putative toxin-antitoxin system antitoxin component (TIGR02293 family)